MILTLQRRAEDPHSTPGVFSINGAFQCWTMEPPSSGVPFPRIAAGGPWPLILRPSPKFQALALQDPWFKQYCDLMPHIEFKDGSVTMIHPGNYPDQSHDCVLVGRQRQTDAVLESRAAFASLWAVLMQHASEGLMIEILDAPSNAENVADALEGE